MQLAGQNNNIYQQTPIFPTVCCCHAAQQAQQQNAPAQPQVQQQAQADNNAQTAVVTNPQYAPAQNYPAGYIPPQNIYPQSQNLQVQPSASGVNIQIFNPSVGTPGAAPTYNVNAPCYPSGYYTGSIGPDGKMYPNYSGTGQQGDNTNNGTIGGNVNTGTNNGTIGDNNSTGASGVPYGNNGAGQIGSNTNNGTIDGNVNTGTNNGVIGNGNSNITNNNTTIDNTNKKKTEKRKIVELTDNYIRNLENYLDSQDKQVRLNAAKEVYARLEEDESRFDDKALTALINKMLQDPSREIRFLALTALDGRLCKGDDYTIGVLQKMQSANDDPLNQEAADASSVLLKMSGRQVEKEFEAKEKKNSKPNEMSEKFKPEGTKLQ